jgi:hypothetical protein
VNHSWAICLERKDAASLAPLRLAAGVELAEGPGVLWLRGPQADESLTCNLRVLPASSRYEVLPGDVLRPIESRIPSERLPCLRWQPIAAWLQAELPVAAMPAIEPQPASLRLVRSSAERTPDVLSTRLEEWRRFGEQAAQVRLDRLSFAASAEGTVIVRGVPLPPLPGCRFVVHGGIAVPAGFTWYPEVSSDVLARRFGVMGEGLVLWYEDGAVTRLHTEQFVRATRSAIHATARRLDGIA